MSQKQNMLGVNNTVSLPATITVGGVTVNPAPQVLVSLGATTAIGTTGIAVFTSALTYPAGIYQIVCEIYMAPPTANWASSDSMTWTVAATTGGSDNLALRYLPYYVTGATAGIGFNIVGLITLTTNSTIKVTPTWSLANTAGCTYILNGFTLQQVGQASET